MGERKVLNKYYPADFDPSKLPKRAKPKNDQQKVRVMLPMTICCDTCKEYIYKGKKFNSRKETVEGEDYLGIKIFRFYIKCTKCSSEITFKTDPEHSDYKAEFGATRNYEPYSWRYQEEVNKEIEKKKEETENDAIARLEARTQQRKNEMEDMEKIDELRLISGKHEQVDMDQVFKARQLSALDEEKQIEDELKSVVFHNSQDFVKELNPDSVIKPVPIIKNTIAKKKILPKKKKNPALRVAPKSPDNNNNLGSLIGSY